MGYFASQDTSIMRVTEKLTLKLLHAVTTDALPVSELIGDGVATGKQVTGAHRH